jgi:phosphoglycerate dehydrogenase-like enzyme
VPTSAPKIAVGPEGGSQFAPDAVLAGGGEIVPWDRAEAAVWMDYGDPATLRALLDEHPQVGWVQLPWAGVEAFAAIGMFDDGRRWTCGKGVYADVCAEHALMLTLALLRELPVRVRATAWGERELGRSLFGLRVCILGGGGLTEAMLSVFAPFGVHTTVVRRSAKPMDGADRTVTSDRLHSVLPEADVLIVALSLTPATVGVVGAAELALLPPGAVLVNVARGRHVDTEAVVDALERGHLGGAGLDVTEPEPLPDGHPLFSMPNAIVTPHCANTDSLGTPRLFQRIAENVRRYAAGEELLGPVDASSGY